MKETRYFVSSLRRESDVASISQVCALRLFWGFFRRWVTVRGYYQGRGEPAGGERLWQSKTSEFPKLF